jgi:Di-haem cytochrome c peroxidase
MVRTVIPALGVLWAVLVVLSGQSRLVAGQQADKQPGKRLFEQETFGGNGRTCLTCHSRDTGTVSPEDAQRRFAENPSDPLFLHDGSDDGLGNGVSRMLSDATILMEIPLPPNVRLADDPAATTVTLRRGIPTTINTPALDTVLMLDGRAPDLLVQAANAISDHTQATAAPLASDLQHIADFQKTNAFFSSLALRRFFTDGDIAAPQLPEGRTASEKRGRLFFEDVPHGPGEKHGICAECHTGPMLNEISQFLPVSVPPGTRFLSVLVSEFNAANNSIRDFIVSRPDGTTFVVSSPDPGRALITGDFDPLMSFDLNAFKTPILWGVRHTAPYFHDNSAKTLEDVAAHYAQFFELVTGGQLILTAQDQTDMVAFMKLLK